MNQGEKFKFYLDSTGKDKSQIAKLMGISRRTLYQMFESKNLREKTIAKIEQVLGVSRDTLFENNLLHNSAHIHSHKPDDNMDKLDLKDRQIANLLDQIESLTEENKRLREMIGLNKKGSQKAG